MPTHVVAKDLLDRADSGEKLIAADRRLCVGYLMATEPDTSQNAMARRFQVDEKSIRNDIKAIKMESAQMVRTDFIDLIAGDIIAEFDRLSKELERSRKQAKIGTPCYLHHIEAQMRMRLKVVESLQTIGILPSNLGEVTVKKHVFKSEVQERTGQVVTRPIDLFDDVPRGETLDADALQLPADTELNVGQEEIKAELDREFGSEER